MPRPITTAGPLVCVPPRQNRNKLDSSRLQPSYILPRPPQAWRLQPCQTMRCWHSTSAHSARMATVQPDRIGAGSPTSEKSSAANLHVVSICTAARKLTWSNWITRELTWSNWIVWLRPEPFPKAVMGDERIRTLGDAWQRAIGNVIAGPAWCPTG